MAPTGHDEGTLILKFSTEVVTIEVGSAEAVSDFRLGKVVQVSIRGRRPGQCALCRVGSTVCILSYLIFSSLRTPHLL